MPETTAVLHNKKTLEAKINEARKIVAIEPSKETKDKKYWVQAYFNTGKFQDKPDDILPFQVGTFSAVNSDGSGGGATGGSAYVLTLGPAGVEFDMALRWTCLVVGSYKAAVVESTKAQDGYDKASGSGNSIISKEDFSGVDDDGEAMTIRLRATSTAGQKAVYTITQEVFSS